VIIQAEVAAVEEVVMEEEILRHLSHRKMLHVLKVVV